ncbi:MAG: arylamine N-acetyltransferase [Actinomycetota bacterium]
MNVDHYLQRIGFTGAITHDRATLEALQRAHLSTVPFENLHVYHRLGVRTDTDWSVAKIVDDRRGGWCFENNGAFGLLLRELGFDVVHLGAAVLLGGPTTVIDHLTLEVMLDEPWLVDVGFGDSFFLPLALNRRGPQDGGAGTFELIDSSQGLTLTRHDDQGVPEPQYRFRRVAHRLSDFDTASNHLQTAEHLHWRNKPFATRLLQGGPDRVTLTGDRLKLVRNGEETVTTVSPEEWDDVLRRWFAMGSPLLPAPPSADRPDD